MENTSNTKNFVAHGGGEWVIGGKLTFLPGAVVEGGDGLFDRVPEGNATQGQIAYIPDSAATSVATLRESFNALLAALRTAGLMATAAAGPSGSDPETGT